SAHRGAVRGGSSTVLVVDGVDLLGAVLGGGILGRRALGGRALGFGVLGDGVRVGARAQRPHVLLARLLRGRGEQLVDVHVLARGRGGLRVLRAGCGGRGTVGGGTCRDGGRGLVIVGAGRVLDRSGRLLGTASSAERDHQQHGTDHGDRRAAGVGEGHPLVLGIDRPGDGDPLGAGIGAVGDDQQGAIGLLVVLAVRIVV